MPLSRVGLEATLWDEPTTGIGLCVRSLASALGSQGMQTVRFGARRSGEFPRRGSGKSPYIIGRLPDDLARSGVPLFHSLGNFTLPLLRPRDVRFVLTVHDLIPLLFPRTVSTAFRWQFRLWLSRSVHIADAITCPSAHTREDLIRHFGVEARKVTVVHNGVDHIDDVPPCDATSLDYLRSLALPEQFVLYAGALDARKNVELLLEAMTRLQPRRTLVLLGQKWFGSGPLERRIATLRADGFDIRALGYQPASIFYEVMRRASVFVFPSRYEGFGLPPLEAMHLGTPTITSNAGSIPEICAGGAMQVGVDDADALAKKIGQLLSSQALRAEWSSAGKARARNFTWRRAAERTLEVYGRLLD